MSEARDRIAENARTEEARIWTLAILDCVEDDALAGAIFRAVNRARAALKVSP